MKPKLSSNIILRVDENLKDEIERLQQKSGCPISEVLRQCLLSLVEYYKVNKSITLPVAIIPKAELAHLRKNDIEDL